MNRRDFLLFKVGPKSRVAELSCERLFMHYVDSQFVLERANAEATDVNASDGEPPAVIDRGTTEQLFAEVARRLQDADVVRIVDAAWLARDDFRERVESLLGMVRARGGHVEFDPGALTGSL
jgi:sugar/nucleoside kinase (ribokinase family)